jgi:hypothetical protein
MFDDSPFFLCGNFKGREEIENYYLDTGHPTMYLIRPGNTLLLKKIRSLIISSLTPLKKFKSL